MKKISLFILLFFLPQTVLSNCDWTQIKKNSDNTYTYSEELHLCVGKLVQDDKVKDQQIIDLTAAIQLKDLAIKMSDERVSLWEKTADDEMSRLNTIEKDRKTSDWISFGLGALTVIGAAYVVHAVNH